MAAVAFGGGLLNRVRGGWGNCPNPQLYLLDGGVLTHDGFPRFLVAGMTGLLAALLCSLRWPLPKRFSRRVAPSERLDGSGLLVHIFGRLVVGAIVTFMVYLGLFVGWGVYYSMGRNEDDYTSRPGVFDYLIGKECEGWPFSRRWLLEYSLRGLVQTVPVGYVLGLSVGGLGPLLEERPVGSACQHPDDQRRGVSCGLSVMLSGLCMGLMYELGWDTPSSVANFSTGTELGELYWGTWSWWMVMLPLVTYARGYSRYGCCPSSPSRKYESLQDEEEVAPLLLEEYRGKCEDASSLRCWTWRDDLRKLGMSCLTVFTLALFLGSAVTYGRLKQSDSTNKNQSWLGICQALGTVLLLQLICSIAVWLSSSRPESFRLPSPVKDCVLCCATVPEELLLASRHPQQSSSDDFLSQEETSLMGSPMTYESGLQSRKIVSAGGDSVVPTGGALSEGRRSWRGTLRMFLCEGRQPYAFLLTVFNFICVMQLLVVGCALLMGIVGNWALGSCNVGITASYEAQG